MYELKRSDTIREINTKLINTSLHVDETHFGYVLYLSGEPIAKFPSKRILINSLNRKIKHAITGRELEKHIQRYKFPKYLGAGRRSTDNTEQKLYLVGLNAVGYPTAIFHCDKDFASDVVRVYDDGDWTYLWMCKRKFRRIDIEHLPVFRVYKREYELFGFRKQFDRFAYDNFRSRIN